MKKYVRPLVALLMFATFMVLYLTEFRHVVIFHEQHHLFIFSADYLKDTLHEKGPVWVAMEFIVQFGYWPWLGALVWSAILVGIYLMTQSIIRRLTGFRDLLQLSAILPCMQFFQTVDIDKAPTQPVVVFAIVLAVWLLTLIVTCFYKPKMRSGSDGKWWWLLVGPACFAIIFGIVNYRFYAPRTVTLPSGRVRELTREDIKSQKHSEALMLKADQAVRRKDWPQVQKLAEEALAGGKRNHLMAYFRSMALYHQGKLPQEFFNFPANFGQRALFFPWKADKNQAEYGGYVYEQLGALNTAIHWEFEALVGWGETAQHISNLARYYIATGKPRQAAKFIYPLSRTLFYRGEARQLKESLASDNIPGLHNAYAGTNVPDKRWDAVEDLSLDLAFLLTVDKDNQMAQQYLLLSLLLQNDVGRFFGALKVFYPKGNKNLPPVYQQALCIYRQGYGEEAIREAGFAISPDVDAQMKAYLSEYQKGQNALFSPAQKRTFWYYIHFLSPEGQTVNV